LSCLAESSPSVVLARRWGLVALAHSTSDTATFDQDEHLEGQDRSCEGREKLAFVCTWSQRNAHGQAGVCTGEGCCSVAAPPTTLRHTSLTCCGGGHMHLFISTSDACLTVPSLSHSLFARAHVHAQGTEIFKQNNSSRLLLVKESSSTHSPTWPRLPHQMLPEKLAAMRAFEQQRKSTENSQLVRARTPTPTAPTDPPTHHLSPSLFHTQTRTHAPCLFHPHAEARANPRRGLGTCHRSHTS
jgi:hypothetical protein